MFFSFSPPVFLKDMLNEIRLEKAMVAELQGTANVIKKTGMFDNVDRIYGDYDAMNSPQQAPQEGGEEGGMGGGGGAPMGGDLGGGEDMDLGEPGAEGGPDMGGAPGETGMEGAPAADGGAPLQEVKRNATKSFMKQYLELLSENEKKAEDYIEEAYDFDEKNVTMEATINKLFNKVDNILEKSEKKEVISETAKDKKKKSKK